VFPFPASSNGRTSAFGAEGCGSIPRAGANSTGTQLLHLFGRLQRHQSIGIDDASVTSSGELFGRDAKPIALEIDLALVIGDGLDHPLPHASIEETINGCQLRTSAGSGFVELATDLRVIERAYAASGISSIDTVPSRRLIFSRPVE
jgi:hypothetical protein